MTEAEGVSHFPIFHTTLAGIIHTARCGFCLGRVFFFADGAPSVAADTPTAPIGAPAPTRPLWSESHSRPLGRAGGGVFLLD